MPVVPVRAARRLLALCSALLVVGASWVAPLPGHAAEPAKLVLVLDSSGSMKAEVNGHSKISIAKSSLRTVVTKLPADAAVGLRVYGATVFDRSDKGACTDSQLVVPIGTGNRDRLQTEIRRYKPYGETPISYSLRKAAEDLGSGEGKRTILLVSDGEETCHADPCATAAAIAKNDIDVKIDVVGLAVGGSVRSQLQCVARRGNGTYYDADSQADLEDSLDKLATRAFRPFRLTGSRVRGSTSTSGAPTLQPGQYVDSFRASRKPLYYRIPRTAKGSTLHLGFTALPVGTVPGASIRLIASDKSECDWDVALAIASGGSRPLVTSEVASWRGEEESPCNTDDDLLAQVSAANDDLAGAKFELLVGEEPPLADDADLPPAQTRISWQKMTPARKATKPPAPGTSLSDAPVLTAGSYQTSILTNETQVFAIPADWGQRVQVALAVPPRRGALARALGGSDTLDLQLLGAGRGPYVNLPVSKLPARSYGMPDDATTYRIAGSTPTIRYLNRSQPGALAFASVPGTQYAVINLGGHFDKPFLVRYTLQVEVLGTAGTGKPAYAGVPTPTPAPTPTTPAPSVSPTPEPSAGATPAGPPSQGVAPSTVVAVAAGALVLGALAALGLVAVRRRRRPA